MLPEGICIEQGFEAKYFWRLAQREFSRTCDDGWSRAVEKALRDCHADLPGDLNAHHREWWSLFIGSAGVREIPATGLFVLSAPLPGAHSRQSATDLFSVLRRFPGQVREARPSGAASVQATLHVAEHRTTVNSSVSVAERRAPQRPQLPAATPAQVEARGHGTTT